MIKAIAGTALNMATGGAWGSLKWLGRRFKGNGDKQTFMGRMMDRVASHFIIAFLMGSVSLWGLFKVFGRAVLYFCVAVLHLSGGNAELPADEDAKAKGFIAKAKDAVDDRMERLKEKMEREAEEQQRKHEAQIGELKRAADAKVLSESIGKLQKQGEEETLRKRIELACRRAQLSAKIKADGLAAIRVSSKAKATFKPPSFWGRSEPDSTQLWLEHHREQKEIEGQAEEFIVNLAKVGLSKTGGFAGAGSIEKWAAFQAYEQDKSKSNEQKFMDRIGPVEEWNAFQRTNNVMPRFFFDIEGNLHDTDPGFIEPHNETTP